MTENGQKRLPIRGKRNLFVVMPIGLAVCLLNALLLHSSVTPDSLERRQTALVGINDSSFPQHPLGPRQTALVGINDSNSTTASIEQAMKGKERILIMLKDAGYLAISKSDLERLPTWQQVVDLYGDSPKIVGLETCPKFRQKVDPRKAFPAAAGPFNSGTNLLSGLLWRNCAFPKLRRKLDHYGKRWQVNYGKHQPPSTRAYHHVYNSINNTIQLPIVAVRDPYSWMQSMCRHGYTAKWLHTTKHCPNLVPNEYDYTLLESLQHDDNITPLMLDDADYVDDDFPEAGFTNTTTVIPVTVEYKSLTTHHTSLAHMWNDWYSAYVEADFPRLMIRMEDLIFYTRNVTHQICTCAGGRLTNKTFSYVTKSAKRDELHEFQYETNLLDAMIRYGGSSTNSDRTSGMTREDIVYAQQILSQDLMNMFGYHYPQTTHT